MPAGLIGAGLGAAGSLFQGIEADKRRKEAFEAEERARREALRFQREQAKRAQDVYRQRMQYAMALRNALLKRYGIEIPGMEVDLGLPGSGYDVNAPYGAPQQLPAAQDFTGVVAPRALPEAMDRGPQMGLTIGELAMRRPRRYGG